MPNRSGTPPTISLRLRIAQCSPGRPTPFATVPEAEPSTNLISLEFDGQQVRTVTKDGKPYFVAKDVAMCLGYSKVSDAVRWHCRGVQLAWMPTAGGRQQAKVIPESDVFRLINGSHLPDAERFKDWVNEEVLPSIRKTGAYVVSGATLGQRP